MSKDDEDEGDVPILAFEEVNMFAVGGDFPRNISKLATRYLTLPCLTLPYLTLPYLTLPYLTLSSTGIEKATSSGPWGPRSLRAPMRVTCDIV